MSAIWVNLLSAALVFVMCFSLFTWLFVYWRPRDLLFWKKTDYFYYLLGVGGILIGLGDSFRQDIQRQISGVNMQLESDYRSLYVEVNFALSTCEAFERAKRLEQQEVDDERHGIRRPLPYEDPFGGKVEEILPLELPEHLTNDDCILAHTLHDQVARKQTPISENLRKRSGNQTTYFTFDETWMDSCDVNGRWAREVCNMLRSTEELVSSGVKLRNEYDRINGVEHFSAYWKFLLAIALALRISKVYAEMNLERVKVRKERKEE